jgi:hypothetical protein
VRDRHEEWEELCQQASVEQGREKQFQFVRRINDLLEAKDRRLQLDRPPKRDPALAFADRTRDTGRPLAELVGIAL